MAFPTQVIELSTLTPTEVRIGLDGQIDCCGTLAAKTGQDIGVRRDEVLEYVGHSPMKCWFVQYSIVPSKAFELFRISYNVHLNIFIDLP